MSSNTNQDTERRIIDPNPDRERGILTAHDRAFLRAGPGEGVREDMSDTAIRQKRHKIRNRFRNALIDVQYLLLLESVDMGRLFPSDEWDKVDRGIVYGALLAAVYHLLRTEQEREEIFDTLGVILKNEVIREYAEDYGVFPNQGITLSVDVPEPDECPEIDVLLEHYQDGEELPYEAHMALDYAGLHPNPDEYL